MLHERQATHGLWSGESNFRSVNLLSVNRVLASCAVLFGLHGTGNCQESERPTERTAVYVDPVNLTEVSERILTGLDVCAVVKSEEFGQGVQKAADVWGLHVDLFVTDDAERREFLLTQLVKRRPAALITDTPPAQPSRGLIEALAEVNRTRRGGLGPLPIVSLVESPLATKNLPPLWATLPNENKPRSDFERGFHALKAARAELLPQIPKYDEIFPIAFPISPMPDSFFQATKFPYPDPVIRSVRTVSSRSASAHAHTSCHANALLGNMIHRTSKSDTEIFLLGFEGGNLSIKATPDAVTREKLSAVMTSYVFALRGNAGERIDLLSENDGVETSRFTSSFHSPEELDSALTAWKNAGTITEFDRVSECELVLGGFRGADRRFRASFFIISSDMRPKEPELVIGVDGYGRWVFEMTSTQQFVQLFVEVPEKLDVPAKKPTDILDKVKLAGNEERDDVPRLELPPLGKKIIAPPKAPRGGILNESGTSVGSTVGFPLGSMLVRIEDNGAKFQPYVACFEGGFLVVTPEAPLTEEDIAAIVRRLDFDERGPLGSDQTLTFTLYSGKKLVFRRTVLHFGYLDRALEDIKQQAWISGWEYVGARGRGLAANIVLHNFLGKHRKFMSSLNTWPSTDRPERPYIRWYVDGMQRLNFSLVTPEGWRQEFVEVPIRVPPIPRDVELYSGVGTLD